MAKVFLRQFVLVGSDLQHFPEGNGLEQKGELDEWGLR